MPLGNRNISPSRIKPEGRLTCTWSTPSAGSGTLSNYELRYYINDATINTFDISTNLSGSAKTHSFVPDVILAEQTQKLTAQIRVKNSYNKYSSWVNFPAITIYYEGMSVAKIGGTFVHVRAYVKVNGTMYRVQKIKVKRGGVIYNIDQYMAPITPPY